MNFKQFKNLQNKASNMFNKLRLFMTVRSICFDSTNLLAKKDDMEEHPYGFIILYDKNLVT